jgi:phosphoenolpyruvate synthase/pyruvate phosphate dikinase
LRRLDERRFAGNLDALGDFAHAHRHIHNCFAAHRQDDSPGGMGVLIQPAINAEVAGVCYSVDPVEPVSGRLVISACW